MRLHNDANPRGAGRFLCAALLIPQPANTRGPNTVMVRIGAATVGYLHSTAATEFLDALRAKNFDLAACGAMIIPIEQYASDRSVQYRVCLDAAMPFTLKDPVLDAPAASHLDRSATNPSRPPLTQRSLFI